MNTARVSQVLAAAVARGVLGADAPPIEERTHLETAKTRKGYGVTLLRA